MKEKGRPRINISLEKKILFAVEMKSNSLRVLSKHSEISRDSNRHHPLFCSLRARAIILIIHSQLKKELGFALHIRIMPKAMMIANVCE